LVSLLRSPAQRDAASCLRPRKIEDFRFVKDADQFYRATIRSAFAHACGGLKIFPRFGNPSGANHAIVWVLFGRIMRGVTNLTLSPPDLHGFLLSVLEPDFLCKVSGTRRRHDV
jgi:hypothetical protein